MELAIGDVVNSSAEFISDEHQLIERAKRDRDAFSELYRRHYRAIARYVHRRIGEPHTADDLIADVFMTVLQYLPRYRHRSAPFRAWLFRIATNRVNRWARRERKRALAEFRASLNGRPTGESTSGGTLAEQARKAMLSLPPKHQAVLTLDYVEGMPLAEVAAVIGCRVGTVKSRLARGRDALRELLPAKRVAK